MKIALVTRFQNSILYERMKSAIKFPFEMIKAENFQGVQGSVDYLFYCFSLYADWDLIINIDEDAFITDNQNFMKLIQYMWDEKLDLCGMQDGGQCLHRFHNPLVMNPFFNIFSKKFAENAFRNKEEINRAQMVEILKSRAPKIKEGFEFAYDNFEPFYSIFFWAHINNFRFLYLDSYEFSDSISTILKNNVGDDFLVHTWYARQYDQQAKRIDDCFSHFTKQEKA